MSVPVTDPTAHDPRQRCHTRYGRAELPVPVEAVAEGLLVFAFERAVMVPSGMLLRPGRGVLANAPESEAEQRLAFASEFGYWECERLEPA